MGHGVLVVPESGHGELTGDHAAPEPLIALEHEHFLPGGGQVGRGHQAVVARANANNIRGSSQLEPPHTSTAAASETTLKRATAR